LVRSFLSAPKSNSQKTPFWKSLPDLHPCQRTCHAPSTCPETEPCESLVTLTCSCGRIRQPVLCGRILQSTSTSSSIPKCNNDCQIAKRNARLADALGISLEKSGGVGGGGGGGVVYNDELVGFARGNGKFLSLVEKTFAE
jgi:transcriptional repressor NF-X1